MLNVLKEYLGHMVTVLLKYFIKLAVYIPLLHYCIINNTICNFMVATTHNFGLLHYA